MKTIILIFISFFCSLTVQSQDSLFFFKKDTIYITYNKSILNTNVLIEYEKVVLGRKQKNVGLITTYNLLDSVCTQKKMEQNQYIENHPGVGNNGTFQHYFGLYFTHTNINSEIKPSEIKNTIIYKKFKTHFLEKKNKTHQDSLIFDNFVLNNILRSYKPANTRLLFTQEDLKSKKIIHFDGSTKMYNKIKALTKEPIYIYMLEKKIVQDVKKNKYNSREKPIDVTYFIFNEVALKRKPLIR